MPTRTVQTFALVACLLLLGGCDAAGRHKVLSTLFDGYPALPPADQYCSEFVARQAAEEPDAPEKAREEAANRLANASRHRPYAEKKCDDCHDKSQKSGLIAPPRELCFVCHRDFIKGDQVHGPVAVGECQACHLPHSSIHPSLLKTARETICGDCHREERLAADMHARVDEKKIACADCHDPHFADARYFLK